MNLTEAFVHKVLQLLWGNKKKMYSIKKFFNTNLSNILKKSVLKIFLCVKMSFFNEIMVIADVTF